MSLVATTALPVSENGFRSNLRASKIPGGACPQTPLVLHAYARITWPLATLVTFVTKDDSPGLSYMGNGLSIPIQILKPDWNKEAI